MVYAALKEREEAITSFDPDELKAENKETALEAKIVQDGAKLSDPRICQTLTCLPTNKNGVLAPEFWRYYKSPWLPIFYDYNDPFNDIVTIVWGPRGGGKTITSVSLSIIDGQMKGIPCISNVPFAWIAKDSNGKLYKIENILFDQELFAHGDQSLKYKRLFVDEGNYLADRLRSTSNKNLAMTDILQQARKFRMCVVFATINWMWLDPRVTGSLCDILIECNDLYYRNYGKKHGMKKGYRIAWDITDQSGKLSGRQFNKLASTTFNSRYMWQTFNTENFVNPQEARKKLMAEQKMIIDEFGNQVPQTDWLGGIREKVIKLAKTQNVWEARDFWDALGIDDQSHKVTAGRFIRSQLGIDRTRDDNGAGRYDLSEVLI
jgi:hypothetical protein